MFLLPHFYDYCLYLHFHIVLLTGNISLITSTIYLILLIFFMGKYNVYTIQFAPSPFLMFC